MFKIFALFHYLAADNGENNDLAKAQPNITKEMTALLHQWYKDTGARFLQA